MKTCVETGNLRHIGEPFGDRFNRRQIVWLVQRGKRHQAIQFCKDLRCHNRWASILRATMHDAVADANHLRVAVHGSSHAASACRASKPSAHLGVGLLIDEDSTRGVPCENSW